MRAALVAAALAVFFLSCVKIGPQTGPYLEVRPELGFEAGDTIISAFGQQEVSPSPMHVVIYRMMELCTGRQGELERVRWFVADSLVQHVVEGGRVQPVWGIWNTESGAIVLKRGLWNLPPLIGHEALHSIYQGEIPPGVEKRCIPAIDGESMRQAIG